MLTKPPQAQGIQLEAIGRRIARLRQEQGWKTTLPGWKELYGSQNLNGFVKKSAKNGSPGWKNGPTGALKSATGNAFQLQRRSCQLSAFAAKPPHPQVGALVADDNTSDISSP
jgi:hypothetical protein